jgi:alpha-galactosidase
MILAVGWPAQWATVFQRQAERGVHVTAGQQLTHLYLKPGETVRSPLIALLFWKGTDTDRAQNIWRRWMLAHNLPRPGGQLPKPIYPFCDAAWFPGMKTSEAGEKQFMDILAEKKVKIDYWWLDAGWYPNDKGWWEVGTWEPDPVRFPHGIKPVSDYAHARGMKMVMWFEPERVFKGSWLAQNHHEWLLGGTERQILDLDNPEALAWLKAHWYEPEGMLKEWQSEKHPEWLVGGSDETMLMNLGNPDAWSWVTNHFDKLITDGGIDVYRQDFNMDPLEYWRNNDGPDRQGVTENLHVQGYLAYWDELRHRHPDLLIDTCASGGRRLDLETLRRGVPLLRSDYQPFDGNPEAAVGNQGHTYGISSWIPYYGQGVYYIPKQLDYTARSYLCPAWGIAVDARKPDINWDLYRRLEDQWRRVVDRMLGDYYPLTPYTLQKDGWMAWQFDRPEHGDGMIQAFRHETTDRTSIHVYLHGLDPAAKYQVENVDGGAPTTMSGSDLRKQGLSIDIKDKPGAVILAYSKVK